MNPTNTVSVEVRLAQPDITFVYERRTRARSARGEWPLSTTAGCHMKPEELLLRYFQELVASRGIGDELCELDGVLEVSLTDSRTSISLSLFDDQRRGAQSGPGVASPTVVVAVTSSDLLSLLRGEEQAADLSAENRISVAGPTSILSAVWTAMTFTGRRRLDALESAG